MERYKKYKAIHRIAYIAFFLYLIILAIGNFSFGEYTPYFIVIPFIAYCSVAIGVRILIRQNAKEEFTEEDKEEKILQLR